MQSGDELLTMTEAANLSPTRPCSSTVWRWCRKGVRARNGQQIRLQHVRMGGQIYTRKAWLDEFGHQLAQADAAHFEQQASVAGALQIERPVSEQDRLRSIENAERFLREAGI